MQGAPIAARLKTFFINNIFKAHSLATNNIQLNSIFISNNKRI